ncbi:reduction in Cnn dots 7 [Musca autumnalis]|uniref:reduction in Cnn dots 7 n=1 Tax=Musca autumnalis TaxID=221902 RepID=UPI003CFA0EE3
MAINFEEIPHEIDDASTKPPRSTRTVLEEITARQHLLQERSIKCKNIPPFYEKPKKRPQRYTYKYFCVCPRYNPQYPCQHSGNVVVDRDVLTPREHIVYLSTPRENKAAPRRLPRFYQKKFVLPNCTARINKLAAPDIKRVMHTLANFKHILPKRHRSALKEHMAPKPKVEYTNIATALEWMEEERRLKKVAKRMERLRCQKISRQILHRQRTQIKKIVCVLFEEMREFLLNDQFIIDDNSPLVGVILETLKEFTDKEFFVTNNLKEYQKILSLNLAVWINKFISNLNIHIAESPEQYEQRQQQEQSTSMPNTLLHEMPQSFLPVADYISYTSSSETNFSGCPPTEKHSNVSMQKRRGDNVEQTTSQTAEDDKEVNTEHNE